MEDRTTAVTEILITGSDRSRAQGVTTNLQSSQNPGIATTRVNANSTAAYRTHTPPRVTGNKCNFAAQESAPQVARHTPHSVTPFSNTILYRWRIYPPTQGPFTQSQFGHLRISPRSRGTTSIVLLGTHRTNSHRHTRSTGAYFPLTIYIRRVSTPVR